MKDRFLFLEFLLFIFNNIYIGRTQDSKTLGTIVKQEHTTYTHVPLQVALAVITIKK